MVYYNQNITHCYIQKIHKLGTEQTNILDLGPLHAQVHADQKAAQEQLLHLLAVKLVKPGDVGSLTVHLLDEQLNALRDVYGVTEVKKKTA
ncbi:hypothetical protein NMY22_g15864 [Coprinellus aureogranulatus]|nr:hypothetical protein NMY22_g15864 [Coprinellus aureogranulatus]